MAGRFALPLLVASLAGVHATAQQRDTVEVGVFGRGTLFDPSLDVTTGFGIGGRAAVTLWPRWQLEADVSTSGVDGLASFNQSRYRPAHVRVNYLGPYSRHGSFAMGVGLVATSFGGDFGKSDAGFAGLFGFRIDLPRSLVARLDATLDYIPSPANGAGSNWNAGLQLGISYRFGGR